MLVEIIDRGQDSLENTIVKISNEQRRAFQDKVKMRNNQEQAIMQSMETGGRYSNKFKPNFTVESGFFC